MAYSVYVAAANDAQWRMPLFEPGAPWSDYRMYVIKIRLGDDVRVRITKCDDRASALAEGSLYEDADVLWLPDRNEVPGNRLRFVPSKPLGNAVQWLDDISVLPVPTRPGAMPLA